MTRTIVCCLLVATHAIADDRPNILFAISDDQSFPHASAYGCEWVNTPAFDRVAKSGVLFTNAFAPTPGCSPTRACILTGRHAWQNREAGTHASSFPSDLPVYTQLLEQAGYFVGSTGKGWGPGNFRTSGWKQNPAGKSWGKRKTSPPHKGISRNDYAANFADFLNEQPDGKPFCFWFGASEPHRTFEKIVDATDEKLATVKVPPYLPDVPEVRADLLAYAREIEWFDGHLNRMLKELESRGQLENTIVIVTSDNGMSFPRAKANLFEDGIHMPLAIAWPKQVPPDRKSNDLVSLIDIAPTLLEAAGIGVPETMAGISCLSLLRSSKSGTIDPNRNAVFAARERHSSSRFHSLGYPQRAIRTQRFLYIRNARPERWPAGAPQKLVGAGGSELKPGPNHGGYHDIDACPTLSLLINHRAEPEFAKALGLAVDLRPAEELYDIRKDPGCLENLALNASFDEQREQLSQLLLGEMKATGDPRANGDGDVFETYPRYSGLRRFPTPGWVEQQPKRVPDQPWWNERVKQAPKKRR